MSNPANQQSVPYVHGVASPSSSASRPTLAGQFRRALYAAGVSAKTMETLVVLAAGLDAALFDTGTPIPLQLTELSPQLTEFVATRLACNLPGCFNGVPLANRPDVDEAMRTLNDLETARRKERSAEAETVGAIGMIIENLLEFLELSKHTSVAREGLLIDLAADDPETLQQARAALLDSVATGIVRIGVSMAAKLPMLPATPTPGTTGSSSMRAPWLDQAPRIVAPSSAQQFPGAAVGGQQQAVPGAHPASQLMPYPASPQAHGYGDFIYQQQPVPLSTDAATSFLPSSAQTWPSIGQYPASIATPIVRAPAPDKNAAPSAPVPAPTPDPAPQLTPRSSKKPGRFKQLLQKLSQSKRQQLADARQAAQRNQAMVADAGKHDSWGSDDDVKDDDVKDDDVKDDGGKATKTSAPPKPVNGHDSFSEDSTDDGELTGTTAASAYQASDGGMALQGHKNGDLIFCTPGMLLNLLRACKEEQLQSPLKKIAVALHMLPQGQMALIPDLITAVVSNAGTMKGGIKALRKAAQTLQDRTMEGDPLHTLACEILNALKK